MLSAASLARWPVDWQHSFAEMVEKRLIACYRNRSCVNGQYCHCMLTVGSLGAQPPCDWLYWVTCYQWQTPCLSWPITFKLNWNLPLPIWTSQMCSGEVFHGQTRQRLSYVATMTKRCVWRSKDEAFKPKNTGPAVKHGGGSTCSGAGWLLVVLVRCIKLRNFVSLWRHLNHYIWYLAIQMKLN